ncbi:spermine synthase-like [Sarcoptes scabiei]|nr:spermine synthase-like [Sarcoptes scabiei]
MPSSTMPPVLGVGHSPPRYDSNEMINYPFKTSIHQSPLPVQSSPYQVPKRFKLGLHGRMRSFERDDQMDIMYMPSSLTPKPQRLLPANIFVVLYNFRSRQIDELNLRFLALVFVLFFPVLVLISFFYDLFLLTLTHNHHHHCIFFPNRPGYLVTVIDTTDHDWWQGKCMGKVGFFPSKYVTKLFPGERPLQVIHTVQLTDGEFAIKLLREQVGVWNANSSMV